MLQYSIKHHGRARHIRIKVDGLGKVEVVAPPGVSQNEIHCFVQKNTAWVYKTIAKLKDVRLSHPDLSLKAPQNISFKAISRSYSVSYYPVIKRAQVRENDEILQVYSSSEKESLELLRGWLQKKAKLNLIPWLDEVSLMHQISYNKVCVRGQKTRWGSCSTRKNINLNRNLLFLAPELVNYLMVHELSHIIQPNHSKHFWSQVAQCEPNYRRLDSELTQSHKTVPLWAYNREV